MAEVLTLVRGTVEPAAVEQVRARYRAGVSGARPPGLQATWLLHGADGSVAVATLWQERSVLDAMIATGEEPFARRLIREAGGDPTAEFFDVLESSASP